MSDPFSRFSVVVLLQFQVSNLFNFDSLMGFYAALLYDLLILFIGLPFL